jgi:carbon-monoxide dehydrogenase small subunit
MKISFLLNGKKIEIDTYPTARLSDILKDSGKISSVRTSCNSGECKSCSVFISGDVAPSCLIPAFAARGCEIVTLEGFSKTKDYNDIMHAFAETGADPCDLCRGGTILTIHAILERFAEPNEDQILDAFSGKICPCTNMDLIIKTVRKAALHRKRKHIGRK